MSLRPRIIFRCDANDVIGYGHLSRCYSLFEILKDSYNCEFAVSKSSSTYLKLFVNDGVQSIHLDNNDDLLEHVRCDDIIVFDTYDYILSLIDRAKKKGASIVIVDDFGLDIPKADLIINHAPLSSETNYKYNGEVNTALGLDYALLRPPFLNLSPARTIQSIQRVFVCLGGTDQSQLITNILGQLHSVLPQTNVELVINASARHYFNKYKKLSIHNSLEAKEMRDLMSKCDLAIVPASTLSIEAFMCKCLIIMGLTADNQRNIYTGLLKFENVNGVGALDNLSDDIMKSIVTNLTLPQEINYKFEIRENILSLFNNLTKS